MSPIGREPLEPLPSDGFERVVTEQLFSMPFAAGSMPFLKSRLASSRSSRACLSGTSGKMPKHSKFSLPVDPEPEAPPARAAWVDQQVETAAIAHLNRFSRGLASTCGKGVRERCVVREAPEPFIS